MPQAVYLKKYRNWPSNTAQFHSITITIGHCECNAEYIFKPNTNQINACRNSKIVMESYHEEAEITCLL